MMLHKPLMLVLVCNVGIVNIQGQLTMEVVWQLCRDSFQGHFAAAACITDGSQAGNCITKC